MQFTKLKIFISVLFLFTGFYLSYAQDSGRKKFSINGHEFLTSKSIKSAKIETILLSNLSYGSTGQLNSKGIIIDDKEYLSFSGSLLYAGGNFDYQQKINDWFAIYLKLHFLGRLGTQIPTILAEGINTASGFEIGWLGKIYEHKKGYLSGSLFSSRNMGSLIDFTGFIEDIIDEIPNPKIIDVVPVSRLGAGLHYAHAFSETWGTQLELNYFYGETLARNTTSSKVDLGIYVDANFYPKKQIPLGIGMGYNFTSMPESLYRNDKAANIYNLHIAYTKASDFELGLEITYHKIPSVFYKTTPKVITNNLIMVFRF